MSSRGRIFALVALAAVAASGVVVVGVLATRGNVPTPPKPRAGHPSLALDFGLRTDDEARALEEAQRLYREKQYAKARAIFDRYHSLEAQVGAAMAAWPDSTIATLEGLRADHPRSSLVAIHLGLALFWGRRDDEALAAWRAAVEDQPDTPYAVRAGDFLHPPPQFVPGLPRFVPSFPLPRRIEKLPQPEQFIAIQRAAARGGARAKILYGSALQQLDRPVSAERQFAAAARLAPNDPEARTAAAVGLFDKANLSRAFSRLGPLTKVFPHAQTVRFHLGVMLVWSAQVKEARRQFRLAEHEDPHSALRRQAQQYLQALHTVRTP